MDARRAGLRGALLKHRYGLLATIVALEYGTADTGALELAVQIIAEVATRSSWLPPSSPLRRARSVGEAIEDLERVIRYGCQHSLPQHLSYKSAQQR